jgi:hypothetical protein
MFAAFALCSSLPALAQARELICTNGVPYQTLTAQLETSDGQITLSDAYLTDNFGNANLICVGRQLEEITCVGFWFHHPEHVVKVEVRRVAGQLASRQRLIEGNHFPIPSDRPWPCQVE